MYFREKRPLNQHKKLTNKPLLLFRGSRLPTWKKRKILVRLVGVKRRHKN